MIGVDTERVSIFRFHDSITDLIFYSADLNVINWWQGEYIEQDAWSELTFVALLEFSSPSKSTAGLGNNL